MPICRPRYASGLAFFVGVDLLVLHGLVATRPYRGQTCPSLFLRWGCLLFVVFQCIVVYTILNDAAGIWVKIANSYPVRSTCGLRTRDQDLLGVGWWREFLHDGLDEFFGAGQLLHDGLQIKRGLRGIAS